MGTLLARNRLASACMDLSDGLADAVRRVAAASGVGATLEGDAIPVAPAARDWFAARGQDPLIAAVAGGDDYELLFAARPGLRRRIHAVLRHADVPVTRIGACTDGTAVDIHRTGTHGPEVLPLPGGYEHFRPADRHGAVPSDVEGR